MVANLYNENIFFVVLVDWKSCTLQILLLFLISTYNKNKLKLIIFVDVYILYVIMYNKDGFIK
jgi:hypothetical protein